MRQAFSLHHIDEVTLNLLCCKLIQLSAAELWKNVRRKGGFQAVIRCRFERDLLHILQPMLCVLLQRRNPLTGKAHRKIQSILCHLICHDLSGLSIKAFVSRLTVFIFADQNLPTEIPIFSLTDCSFTICPSRFFSYHTVFLSKFFS